jgi:hypothetical protein
MSKDKMIMLLSINVANAYNYVSRKRFMHNLRKRKISNWIMIWANNFIKNKHITLTINDDTTFINRINVDMLSNLSIFFIFYLFYNANILKLLKRSWYKIIVIEFMNDINILIYETSTKNNCKTLKNIHVECELWAKRYETRFASIKYKLMHLTKNHRRFNMTIIINIKKIIKKSFISMKVLKMQFNIKFKWDSHVKKIHDKMTTQMLAFTRLITSTWKVCFKKTKHVYTTIVKLIIKYEFSMWHALHERSNLFIKFITNLIDLQKQNLRDICDAFKTTFHQFLNVET